ncbi:MAG TPA: ATP F0F1 synthase subunit C [Chloroflexi bacterium]|jgi:F-type H+-transporting ATPase subunit c|nr:ATP F0F1 synthase subunit C [Chloroflexota bacterium]
MLPEQQLQFAIVTTIVVGAAIVLGTITTTLMEGRAVVRAFDNMARQPSVADRIRGLLFVVLAILESCAIYVLLICLILLFANPFANIVGM